MHCKHQRNEVIQAPQARYTISLSGLRSGCFIIVLFVFSYIITAGIEMIREAPQRQLKEILLRKQFDQLVSWTDNWTHISPGNPFDKQLEILYLVIQYV